MDNSPELRHRWVTASAAVVTVLVMVALAAACGGGDDQKETGGDGPEPTAGNGGSAAEIDACALITREEAEAALGAPVGEPEREDIPPLASCSYETSDFDVVSVIVVGYEDEEQAADAFQLAIDFNDYEEVNGIGERAYRSPVFGITVLQGRYELSVDVTQGRGDADFEAARDLTEKAINRLP